jgi:transcriptional regulator with XRE-family HTH domain
MPTFGALLKQFLQEADVSLKQLAAGLGVHRNTLGGWINGNRVPDRARVLEIANQLYLSPADTDGLLIAAGYGPEQTADEEMVRASRVEELRVGRLIVDLMEGSQALKDLVLSPAEIFERVRLSDFEGRDWLEHDLDSFLSDRTRDRGVWLLVGEAGSGKTSFLAHLVRERGYTYLFAEHVPGDANLPRALQSIGAQLISRYRLNQITVGDVRLQSNQPDFLRRLLYAVAERVGESEQVVILLDGIDEAGTVPGGNVLGLPQHLPRGIYLVLSQQPRPVALNIYPPPHRVDLELLDPRNQRDMEAFLWRVITTPTIAQGLRTTGQREDDFVRVLMEKSAGNWMYLSYICSFANLR